MCHYEKEIINSFDAYFWVIGLFTAFAISADVPMMTKDELKAMFGGPGLMIYDVGHGSEYFSSDLKLKGATRPLVREFIGDAILTHPKGTPIFVYFLR